jgi:hypothetical protein
MKCPKCGYISFDHNQTCPKCRKSLKEEAAKMSLPDYKPAPPFLLASLLEGARSGGINSIGVGTDQRPGVEINETLWMPEPGAYEDPSKPVETYPDHSTPGRDENFLNVARTAEPGDSEYGAIPFDPAGMSLDRAGREEEPLTVAPGDFDFEPAENEDQEKPS